MSMNNKPAYISTHLDNPSGYLCLIILIMFYMAIMLCNAVLTNRYVGSDDIFILGGTLTSPFIFILDGIITEIYGYKVALGVILSGFIMQTMVILICCMVVIAPYPSMFKNYNAYYDIFGPSLMKINISTFSAYIISNCMNSYIIARCKILVKGRYFWLRCIGASTFSEAIYSFLAIIMMELNSIPFNGILHIAIYSYFIKVIYNVLFAVPANLTVNFIKHKSGIDMYEFPTLFTPFKYKSV